MVSKTKSIEMELDKINKETEETAGLIKESAEEFKKVVQLIESPNSLERTKSYGGIGGRKNSIPEILNSIVSEIHEIERWTNIAVSDLEERDNDYTKEAEDALKKVEGREGDVKEVIDDTIKVLEDLRPALKDVEEKLVEVDNELDTEMTQVEKVRKERSEL